MLKFLLHKAKAYIGTYFWLKNFSSKYVLTKELVNFRHIYKKRLFSKVNIEKKFQHVPPKRHPVLESTYIDLNICKEGFLKYCAASCG